MEAIKTFAEEGGKVLAECGGMMFLTRSLTARQGERPMLWRASCHWTVQWWGLGCIWGIVG